MAKNSQFFKKNNPIMHIYGFHSVKAAIENPIRKKKKLILSENSSESYKKYFLNKIQEIRVIPKKDFEKKYYSEESSQGIVLEVYKLPETSFSKELNNNNKNSIIIMLDQVKDPQNIGSIMRSAALFGCTTIITSNKNAPDMNSTIIKSVFI